MCFCDVVDDDDDDVIQLIGNFQINFLSQFAGRMLSSLCNQQEGHRSATAMSVKSELTLPLPI